MSWQSTIKEIIDCGTYKDYRVEFKETTSDLFFIRSVYCITQEQIDNVNQTIAEIVSACDETQQMTDVETNIPLEMMNNG